MKTITKAFGHSEELVNFIKNCMEESMRCVDNLRDLEWYESCNMEDYFTEWTEIWDENDNFIGEGLDTIAHKYVLNEDTRNDFESAFNEAREDAYNTVYAEFSDKVYNSVSGNTQYPEDDERSHDFDAWASEGEHNSCFVDKDGTYYYKIREKDDDWVIVYFVDGLLLRY
jgi:hypothetical protein